MHFVTFFWIDCATYVSVPRGAPRCGLPSLVMFTFVPRKAEVAEARCTSLTTNHVFVALA